MLLQLRHPLELFIRRMKFIPSSGFLSCRNTAKTNIQTNFILLGTHSEKYSSELITTQGMNGLFHSCLKFSLKSRLLGCHIASNEFAM